MINIIINIWIVWFFIFGIIGTIGAYGQCEDRLAARLFLSGLFPPLGIYLGLRHLIRVGFGGSNDA